MHPATRRQLLDIRTGRIWERIGQIPRRSTGPSLETLLRKGRPRPAESLAAKRAADEE